MYYFTYGSNLNREQMQRRPSARFVDVAELANHRLAFTRFSSSRGCGVADIVEAEVWSVWGVVFEITGLADVQRLDRYESVPKAYIRSSIAVFLSKTPEEAVNAATYFARKELHPPLPNAEYKALIVSVGGIGVTS